MLVTNEIFDLLQSPTYTEIVLCMISGKTYAMAISKALEKRQPTVTEQLKELERVGLIKALKRRKAQCYEVNWDLLLEVFYGIVDRVMELRGDYMSENQLARIKKTNLHGVIPKDLIEGFLKEYCSAYKAIGGKKKGFDDIIFSFFSAIGNLDKRDLKRLVAKFRIDESILSDIAFTVEFEFYGTELTALQCYLNPRRLERRKNPN